MDTLRQLQLTQVEILKEIDRVCKKHNIKYSLYAGTLLGAVRHKGFIPWDDDLDICMLRSEYDLFLEAWEKENPVGYILQNKDCNEAYMNSFSKVRKDNTSFLEHKVDIGRFHTGIFVDIFPVDRLPKGKIRRKIFVFQCMLYQLFNRGYASERDGAVIWIGCNLLLVCVPKRFHRNIRKYMLKRITRYSNDNEKNIVFIESYKTMKSPFPADLFDSYMISEFEGEHFMVISAFDRYLRGKYGDYMKLPPKEEQVWTHHPIVINFEKNIEEISEQ